MSWSPPACSATLSTGAARSPHRCSRCPARRRRVGAVFLRLGEAFAQPGFRGCPFINAAAEYPGQDGPVVAVIAAHRAQVRGLFAELLAGLPAARRAALTDQLVLLYDGTMVSAQLDQGARAARRAQAAARRLLEDPHSR